MSAAEKFMFDVTFDNEVEEILVHEESDGMSAVDEEPEIIVPTFSEEDLETARQTAFEAGKEEGLAATTEALTKQINETLIKIDEKISAAFQTQDDVYKELSRAAHSLAIGVCKKMMPSMAKKFSFGEVATVVDEVFTKVIEEPRVTISVHTDIAKAVEERINLLIKEKGHEGKVYVNADETIEASDCSIDWATGGSERDTTELWAEITSIVDRNIGEKPTIWDNPDEIENNCSEVTSEQEETNTTIPLVDNALQTDVTSPEDDNTNNTEVAEQEPPINQVQQTNID